MLNRHSISKHMQEAFHILKQARANKTTLETRERNAIELASCMLQEATRTQTRREKTLQRQLSRMMDDPRGKAFTTSMTDQCFRSQSSNRIANQLSYLLKFFNIPQYLGFWKRSQLAVFQVLAPFLAPILVPLTSFMLRKETSSVILPGERSALSKHMKLRRLQGVRINLNHLGEAILGEEEAKRRLQVYLEDLAHPDVEYVSIKASTIYSQINLIAWEETLEVLSERLRSLYRVAMNNYFEKSDDTKLPKFVNLDMEEYHDIHLTKALFMKVLSETEFLGISAGIVLQAYLPDAFPIQQEITEWAMQRVANGGAPIKVRIVKGANLAMEQFEASLKGWPQAPYKLKSQVDSNYKRMVTYGCEKQHAQAVHLGVGSHNLFDVAYAMLLRAENEVEEYVSFEMLEGMADHIRRVVQALSKDILLYCPVATKEDFQSAIAYLIRRLDENTGAENFLRYTFGLTPGSLEWEDQVLKFSKSCMEIETTPIGPRRTQDRSSPAPLIPVEAPFENEPDTDFALAANRKWALEIKQAWENKKIDPIPCVIGGKEIKQASPEGRGTSPSKPQETLYTYTLASWDEVSSGVDIAKQEEASWKQVPLQEKAKLFAKAAQKLRENRANLIGAMMLDGGKALTEADTEVSEAIDFAEYYLRNMIEIYSSKDVSWEPKGTILVATPWNFPIAIPTGGMIAALAAGNCVLFKPAPEATLCGWVLINALWDAGIPKNALQFISCVDDPVGSHLIIDQRINGVILTGSTETARLFMKMRPDLTLYAETGGKNSLIITGLSDRDSAIKDLVQSAFGHSGQKCSATSLGILEAEVYDDPHFLRQLKDAIESLSVSSPWNLKAKIVPLIHAPSGALLKGLTQLEPGESWLVEPKQDPNNPNLWSPGVKLGVKPGSFMHQTELFGPVLGLMRAHDLKEAIDLANGTKYGLTSGISSLDERELKKWVKKIEAGNLYINRSTTGAIVRRQPFGGCKASNFGHGSKAGGPNYLCQLATAKQENLPQSMLPPSEKVHQLTSLIEKSPFSPEELGIWYSSISNYTFWAKRLPSHYDMDKPEGLSDLVIGQDNGLYYTPHAKMAYRIQANDKPLDLLRILAAASILNVHLEVSYRKDETPTPITKQWEYLLSSCRFVEEDNASFLKKVSSRAFEHIRLASPAKEDLKKAAAESACYLNTEPVLASGRFELLHYVREFAVSCNYHRYGNLGLREQEARNPIL